MYLIRRHRAVTTTQSSEPRLSRHLLLASICCHCASTDGPLGSWSCEAQAPASSASSVAQPVSARRRHRPPAPPTPHPLMRRGHSQPKNTRGPCRQLKTASRINIGYDERHRAAPTAELHSSLAHDIGHVIRSHCPMQWKSWKVMPDETKTEVRGQLSTNYNLEDLDDESLAYVNRLFSERYKQWKSDLHHHFEAFDDPQVALQEGCPKELEGRRINKAKVNKGNRKKKTLLHHSGSRPFSYRMDARRQGGPNSQRSTSLATFMFDLMSWPSPFIRHGGEEPVGSSGVRLPTSSRYSDRVCGSSTGCWVSDLDGDIGSDSREETWDILSRDGECQAEEPRPRSSAQSNSQVTALTTQVAIFRVRCRSFCSPSHSPAFQSRILMRRPPSPSISSIPTRRQPL
ncbi:hypothetical protein Prudu_006179 [Prunus dulcis]|uniref:Ankyrin repeat family protein n=1 Tax=Prunus dulcis TaxID=3755 RepID=A0A4Y1QZ69_PRUDU|nr:hypothetical protein Prudu_006179 [Prunus dulcis]